MYTLPVAAIVTTSTSAALPIPTPRVVREVFSLSVLIAPKAKRMLSPQELIRPLVGSGKRMVGHQIVAGALGYDAQIGPADQLLQMWHVGATGEEVISPRF